MYSESKLQSDRLEMNERLPEQESRYTTHYQYPGGNSDIVTQKIYPPSIEGLADNANLAMCQ